MDGGNAQQPGIWQNLILLVPIILILVYSIWRRRQRASTKLEVAVGLLSHINHNIKVTESYLKDWRSMKKFKTGNWLKHKDKMGFLDPAIQTAVNEAFNMANDFNQQIDGARRSKTASYVAGLPVEKLREPLTKAKQGIVVWVQANIQTEMWQGRRRGLFG
ncbi:MAG: hypothetical protein Q8O16_01935 [Dehalococcoidia bacterium]|nr:hypothetical protein [Dehalococcoidia bacterium]